jgi:hypothetical protein
MIFLNNSNLTGFLHYHHIGFLTRKEFTMKRRTYVHLAVAGLFSLGLASCSTNDQFAPAADQAGHSSELNEIAGPSTGASAAQHDRTFKGPAVPIGNGKAQTFVSVDENDTPISIGIFLTEKALENLPDSDAQYVLTFHPVANSTQFTHVLFDYNPQGHEPPGVYDVEHFDVHFYTIPIAEREGIYDFGLCDIEPDAQYIPPDYFRAPGCVPEMGAHWLDLLAPEFNGQPFTRTFIWGSYDGEFNFFEPMITTEYLRSEPMETVEIRQPAAFQTDGFYPMDYSISYETNPDAYRIALEGLTFHQGS